MRTMTATIREAKAKLSKLLESAQRGEEVIITSHGKPQARLVPIAHTRGGALDMDRIRKLAKRGWTGKHGPTGTDLIRADRDGRP